HSMVQVAQRLQNEGHPLSPIDFRLHFYPWWAHAEYRLPANLRTISQEKREYFQGLKASHGINIDGQQAVWYVVMEEQPGTDDMRSEYPSTIEEAFHASIQGAYFKREMDKARLEKRVGG